MCMVEQHKCNTNKSRSLSLDGHSACTMYTVYDDVMNVQQMHSSIKL